MTKLRGQWEQPSISALGQKATLQCDRRMSVAIAIAYVLPGEHRLAGHRGRERGAKRLAEAQTVVKMRHSAGPARATPPDGRLLSD